MRILWITNISLPVIDKALKRSVNYGGGWMVGLSEDILKNDDELCVCFPIDIDSKMISGKADSLLFFGIPSEKKKLKKGNITIQCFIDVINNYKPDIIHIWGTEYTHSYCVAKASEVTGYLKSTVVSLQGIAKVYADYYLSGVPFKYIYFKTIKELIYRKGLLREKKQFELRGIYEKLTLNLVPNVIGRTDWDLACLHDLAPGANYYFCNETLRETFYKNKWDINKCKRHSIFASQSQYPIKGFHKLLQALVLVKKRIPDVTLSVTGKDRLHCSLKNKLSFSSYDKYIADLIKNNSLENNVNFLGSLQETDMCNEFLNANIFVSASAIENSPNSLGEAMLLGVPAIASDVGGVKNMMTHKVDGYVYPYEDIYVLADYICNIMLNDSLAEQFSLSARKKAMATHSREDNYKKMMEIYNLISAN